MQLAVRPYVTTGIAIVGASVIAVAPIVPAPTAVQIPNPVTQLERGVQLTVNEIEDAFNQLAFVGAQAAVTLAKLPAPLVAQLLGIPQPAAELLSRYRLHVFQQPRYVLGRAQLRHQVQRRIGQYAE